MLVDLLALLLGTAIYLVTLKLGADPARQNHFEPVGLRIRFLHWGMCSATMALALGLCYAVVHTVPGLGAGAEVHLGFHRLWLPGRMLFGILLILGMAALAYIPLSLLVFRGIYHSPSQRAHRGITRILLTAGMRHHWLIPTFCYAAFAGGLLFVSGCKDSSFSIDGVGIHKDGFWDVDPVTVPWGEVRSVVFVLAPGKKGRDPEYSVIVHGPAGVALECSHKFLWRIGDPEREAIRKSCAARQVPTGTQPG